MKRILAFRTTLFGFPLTFNDLVQIALNVISFLILFLSKGGHGSFWGFLTFNIIAAITLIELLLNEDHKALWVWATKTITYMVLVIKFFHNFGELKLHYVAMIIVSVVAFFISRFLIKNRAIAAWGQVVAYIIGAIMYGAAIIHHPEDFGWGHIGFWLVNLISYALLIYKVYTADKNDKVNLIIPVYAIVTCPVFIVLIMIY